MALYIFFFCLIELSKSLFMACLQTTCISCYSVFQTLKFAVFQIDSTAFLNDKEQGQS